MFASHLECPKCSVTYDPHQPHQLCRCGSPLLVRYDMAKVGTHMTKDVVSGRPPDLWRYRELLPVVHEENMYRWAKG